MADQLPTDDERLIRHLVAEPLPQRVSCFVAALRDARHVTGRDAVTGDVVDEDSTGFWLGVVGYMILLDQIGTCFSPLGAPAQNNQPGFLKALSNFTDLGEDDRQTLYALRCCLAHDYALTNIPKQGKHKQVRTRAFTLFRSSDPILMNRAKPWGGRTHPLPEQITMVNVRAFAELCEEVVAKLIRAAEHGEIEVALTGGVAELEQRYTFRIGPQPSPDESTSAVDSDEH